MSASGTVAAPLGKAFQNNLEPLRDAAHSLSVLNLMCLDVGGTSI